MFTWEECSNSLPSSIGQETVHHAIQRAWVEVDLAALTHNVQQIKRLLSAKTDLMAVVKADAYGHGAVTVAQTVLQAGANWLGVATIPEGIELRQAGISAPILVLGSTYMPAQIQAIAQWQLQPTLCSPKQALTFAETLGNIQQAIPVHLKLDTGMSRLGTRWEEAVDFIKLVQGLPNLTIASVYSHLATAESLDQTILQQQHQRFQQAIHACGLHIASMGDGGLNPHPIRLHLANSAATLTDPALHYDMVRVGLGIYGLYPAAHLQSRITLKPALQVKARITQVKTVPAGTGVSYGHRYITAQETRVATVGIGYADGVPRNLCNRMQVLLRGKKIPQIGAVTMDQLMLDVSSIADLQAGEIVTLIGTDGSEQISADDWATLLDTISWEILCGFKHRLPRIAVNQPPQAMSSKSELKASPNR
jgi:alanine racemase